MTTRSAVIWHGLQARGARAAVYTVPADKLVIVKSINLYNEGTVATTIVITAYPYGSASGGRIIHQDLTPQTPLLWEGWFVLEALTYVDIFTTSSAISTYASGAILPPRPP